MVIQNSLLEGMTKGEWESARSLIRMPLCGGEDQARLQGRNPSGVHASLRGLRKRGVITSVRLGCLRPQTDRSFLAYEGQRQLDPTFASWHQPAYLNRLLERLPSVEHLYPAAAGVTDLGAFRDWQWVDAVSFDAAVRYEQGWAVFFWVGPLRVESRFAERLVDLGEDLEDLAVGNARPRPSLLCCVVYDRFQVEMVLGVTRRLGMQDWVRIWCIGDDSWHGADGHLIGRGWIRQPAYRRNVTTEAWVQRRRRSLWSWESNLDLAQNLAWVLPAIKKAPHSGAIVRAVRCTITTIGVATKARQAARETQEAAEASTAAASKAEDAARIAAATARIAAEAAEKHIAAPKAKKADRKAAAAVERKTAAARKADDAASKAAEAVETKTAAAAKPEEAARIAVEVAERAADAFDHLRAMVSQWVSDHCECVETGNRARSTTCAVHEAAAIIDRAAAHVDNPVGTQDMVRLLYAVSEWPAMTVAMARALLREKPHGRRAQRVLMRLTDLGLLVRWKTGQVYRYRVTKSGMRIVTAFDRAAPHVLWKRIQMGRWSRLGKFTTHEYGVVDLMSQFAIARYPVANGWREWDDMGEYGGIAPDAVVFLPSGPFGPGWYYVEYERSKTSPEELARKLKGFDSPRRKNDWPVLMVCASDQAERNVQQWATDNGVQIVTTTIARLNKHGAVGNEKCWRAWGRPVQLG